MSTRKKIEASSAIHVLPRTGGTKPCGPACGAELARRAMREAG